MDRVRKAAHVEQNASAGPVGCAEIFFGLAAVLLFAEKAHAYGDPGSGALLWQLLLAAMFGGMFYIRRVTSWIRKKFSRKDAEPPDHEVAGDG